MFGAPPEVSMHAGDMLHCPTTGEHTRPTPARHAPVFPQLQDPMLGVVPFVKGHEGARKAQMQFHWELHVAVEAVIVFQEPEALVGPLRVMQP